MLKAILKPKAEQILRDEREALGRLRVILARCGAEETMQERLAQSLHQLDELFLLVVVGEFNAGKSAFINALLGQRLLEEGVTPTTTRIHLLRYGERTGHAIGSEGVHVITAPVEMLREVNIVDTPGTNAIYREHETLTRDFVPRSDLVLFVTSADRPFTESERAFLESIRTWGKKVLIILNKIDILEDESAIAKIEQFIAENGRALLGFAPEIYPISARLALRAKEQNDPALWAASRFAPLEARIRRTLESNDRLRLKLGNPLGVAERLTAEALHGIEERLALLRDDTQALDDIERQMQAYRTQMERDFRARLAEIDQTLYRFQERGERFFEETMQLARLFDLLNKEKLRGEFERRVVADLPQEIDRQVSSLIDWLVKQNLRQWQAVMAHLEARRAVHSERVVGQMGGSFDYDRDRLLATVGQAAQAAVESYDHHAEAEAIAEKLQQAVAETALVEASALGLGAIVTAAFSSAAMDVTGILAAGTLAALGLFVIPARRRNAQKELRQRVATLRSRLMAALESEFSTELQHGIRHIEEAIAPYARFVRAEQQALEQCRQDLKHTEGALRRLKETISTL